MIVYAIRKHKDRWAVSSADDVLTDFTSLDEAINTAVSAMKILRTTIHQNETEEIAEQVGLRR
jgi:hypothetical protein